MTSYPGSRDGQGHHPHQGGHYQQQYTGRSQRGSRGQNIHHQGGGGGGRGGGGGAHGNMPSSSPAAGGGMHMHGAHGGPGAPQGGHMGAGPGGHQQYYQAQGPAGLPYGMYPGAQGMIASPHMGGQYGQQAAPMMAARPGNFHGGPAQNQVMQQQQAAAYYGYHQPAQPMGGAQQQMVPQAPSAQQPQGAAPGGVPAVPVVAAPAGGPAAAMGPVVGGPQGPGGGHPSQGPQVVPSGPLQRGASQLTVYGGQEPPAAQPPAATVLQKRKKTPLLIVNPETQEVLHFENASASTAASSSTKETSSAAASTAAPPPDNPTAKEFQAQVLAVAKTTGGEGKDASKPEGSAPATAAGGGNSASSSSAQGAAPVTEKVSAATTSGGPIFVSRPEDPDKAVDLSAPSSTSAPAAAPTTGGLVNGSLDDEEGTMAAPVKMVAPVAKGSVPVLSKESSVEAEGGDSKTTTSSTTSSSIQGESPVESPAEGYLTADESTTPAEPASQCDAPPFKGPHTGEAKEAAGPPKTTSSPEAAVSSAAATPSPPATDPTSHTAQEAAADSPSQPPTAAPASSQPPKEEASRDLVITLSVVDSTTTCEPPAAAKEEATSSAALMAALKPSAGEEEEEQTQEEKPSAAEVPRVDDPVEEPAAPAPVAAEEPQAADSGSALSPSKAAAERDRQAMPPPMAPKVKPEVASPIKNGQAKQEYGYKLEAGQCFNSEAKKTYDREFLLKLQFAASCTIKPEGLPNFRDIVLDKPHTGGGSQRGPGSFQGRASQTNDFAPNYFVDSISSSQRERGPSRQKSREQRSGRGGMAGGGRDREVQSPGVRKIELKRTVAQLSQSENRWKADSVAGSAGASQADVVATDESMGKEFRAILNKLTPQNYKTLLVKVQDLNINTEARLTIVINLVFEKALDEPNFSVTYAKMCHDMGKHSVPMGDGTVDSETGRPKNVDFRKLLLHNCQREFERGEKVDKDMEADVADAKTEEEKKQKQKELQYQKAKLKRRTLGNVRFIGELFKLHVLTDKIMYFCVNKLLMDKDEESLECLCRLFTTIGKELDENKQAIQRNNQYYERLKKLCSDKKAISSRIRFMIQDLLDLRSNNWVPRRQDNAPKTIEEIHKDAKLETMQQQAAAQDQRMKSLASFPNISTHDRDRGGAMGGRSLGGPGRDRERRGEGPASTNDWQNVMPTRGGQYNKVDQPDKMRLSKGQLTGAPTFGPPRKQWGSGASGGAVRSSQQTPNRPSTPTGMASANRYGALSMEDPDRDMDRPSGAAAGRSGSGSRPDQRGSAGRYPAAGGPGAATPGRKPSAGKGSKEERESALASVKNLNRLRQDGGMPRVQSMPERMASAAPEETLAPAKAPAVPGMSEDQLTKRTKAIVDEYLAIQSMKEAMECVEELTREPLFNKFAYFLLTVGADKPPKAQPHLGKLLHELVLKKVVPLNDLQEGLMEIMPVAMDLAMDIPFIWQNLADMLAPTLLLPACLPLLGHAAPLLKDCDPMDENLPATFVATVLTAMVKVSGGEERVHTAWLASGLRWEDLCRAGQNVPAFLKENGVQFASDSMEVIHRMILAGEDSDKIRDVVTERIADTSSLTFIKAIVTAVCEQIHVAIVRSDGKDQNKVMDNRCSMLHFYTAHKPEAEMAVLLAVHAFVHKLQHPPNLISTLFFLLHEAELISEETFYTWEVTNQDDPGRGVSTMNLKKFYTWLRAEDNDPTA